MVALDAPVAELARRIQARGGPNTAALTAAYLKPLVALNASPTLKTVYLTDLNGSEARAHPVLSPRVHPYFVSSVLSLTSDCPREPNHRIKRIHP
jgi:hypothetical protein